MIAWNSASSSANDVRMRHAVRGCERADLAAHLDAVAVARAARRARRRRGRAAGCGRRPRSCGARLADHLDVALGLEQVAQTSTHDLVIVEEEHADSSSLGHGLIFVVGVGTSDPQRGIDRSVALGESFTRKECAMKALVYHGPGQKAWEEVPDPTSSSPTPTRSSASMPSRSAAPTCTSSRATSLR